MKNNNLNKLNRLLIFISGLALIIVLFVPMWRIDLIAPQYPEGLMLLIYPHELAGNVDIINGLNHYIGMKTLHTNDFIEFKLLPYFISIFSALFILTAILGKRKWLNILFILFICFGVIAMIDFWRWEYNYGHNLNPNAAIIVPGMAYQPPLIGYKQLLNFAAYSMPDIGGWIFVGSGLILLFSIITENKRKIKINKLLSLFFLLTFISSCNTKPEAFNIGKDNCSFCKMKINDARFGIEIITIKGKILKFDDVKCMLGYIEQDSTIKEKVKEIYATNYLNPSQLININQAHLLHSIDFRSPMGGNIAAFDKVENLNNVNAEMKGSIINWKMLYK